MALQAQKKEREKYKQLLKLAIQYEGIDKLQSSQGEEDEKSTLQQTEPEVNDAPIVDNTETDIFRHTYVDIVDASQVETSRAFNPPEKTPPAIQSWIKLN